MSNAIVKTKARALALPPDFIDFEGKSAIPADTVSNARIALSKLSIQFSANEFNGRRYAGGMALTTDAGQLSDEALTAVRVMIRERFKFEPGKNNTWDAINLFCRENAFHPVKDFLEPLIWDGRERLDTWLIDYMGAPDTPFIRAVSRIVLVASVRRIYEPGAKFDHLTVLESPEGFNKSRSLAALYGAQFFSDQTILGLSDKELQEAVRGRWCIECADLSGMRRADIEKVKAQITRQEDRTRPAYGRAVIDALRSCVFWGSTNEIEYLRSQTGNRRFLPVPVQRIDVDAILRDRDQLWAEAYVASQVCGESIMLPESVWAEAGAEQDARTQWDPFIDFLADFAARAARDERQRATLLEAGDPDADNEVAYEFKYGRQRVTSTYLLSTVLGLKEGQVTPEHSHRLGRAMRHLGWEGPKGYQIGGRWVKGYQRAALAAAENNPWD